MQTPENNLITVQTSKEITRLYKSFLEIIEDIRTDHDEMIKKLPLNPTIVDIQKINYLTQVKYEHIRKRVLDSGNECSRQILNFLEFFDFSINKEKVEAVAQQKKIVRKFITNPPLTLK